MSEITRAKNIISAYAFDEDGLTRKECLKEGFSNGQCRALVTVLGRGKKGVITPQDVYILAKNGFSKRFVNELFQNDGKGAAQLRMEWLKGRRDARYCSTTHCLTIWNEFVEIRDILSNKLSNETSHNDALLNDALLRQIWLQEQRDADAERLQAERDHIAYERGRKDVLDGRPRSTTSSDPAYHRGWKEENRVQRQYEADMEEIRNSSLSERFHAIFGD